jgi:folate-binding protein YgfZ
MTPSLALPDTLHSTALPHRGLLAVGGEERATFLHGLLSCAVKDLAPGQSRWGALLTAQGKFLHEVFVTAGPDEILLEGEAERLDDLFTRLKRFRLRSKVTLEQRPDWTVHALWGKTDSLPSGDGLLVLADPRHPDAGWRLYAAPGVSLPAAQAATLADWDRWRCALGLPDGSRDMAIEGATLLEYGFAELGGVDFKKGCFVGQEVTARMRYRGLVKKRLLPITIDGPLPASGSTLRTADGADAGSLASVVEGGSGLALVRLAALEKDPFSVEGSSATVSLAPLPSWVILPEEKA